MTEVRGDSGQVEDTDFGSLLDAEAEQWGSADDEGVLDDLEEEVDSSDVRGVGTDEVLGHLDDTYPEGAKVLRGMQQKMSSNINEFNALKEDVLNIREQLLAQREPQEEEAPTGPPVPEGISEENLALFGQMAGALGFVKQSDLDGKEQEQAVSSNVQDALSQGVELYGDDFGTTDESGNIVVNPEVSERLAARLEKLQDPKVGITPLDLFRLEYPESQGRASSDAERERGNRPTVRRKAGRPNVVRRSSGRVAKTKIYNPERGDTSEDVFDRAFAVAKLDLTQ